MSAGDPAGQTPLATPRRDDSLVRALFEMREARKSGVLTVVADDILTAVVFDRGEPIDATEQGTPGESLGRLLVRTRVLSQREHARVIDAMASALGGDQEKKFGEIAVSLGLLTQQTLDRALDEQVRWRIVRALQRDGSTWSFVENAERVAAAARRELSLDPIVLDAVRWFTPDARKAIVDRYASSFVTLRPDPVEVAKRFGMTAEEQGALEAFDGTVTAAELLAIKPTSAGADVAALLVALLAANALELGESPRPGARDPGTGLAVARASSRPPSQYPKPQERAAKTAQRLKRLAAARLPPSPPQDRKPQNEREARVLAEQCFQHGMVHLRANRLADAVPLLRRAFGLMPKNLEYELYAMWVEVRVHEAKPNAAQLAALRNIAVAAIRQDPNLAFAFYVLGQVTLDEGDESLAKRHFAHALRLDPDAIDAERQVRILKRRTPGSRVPQVRRSRPPAPPSGTALARVALKKASLNNLPRPPIMEDTIEVAPESAPVVPAASAAASEPPAPAVATYTKVSKTLEMPMEIASPSPAPAASSSSSRDKSSSLEASLDQIPAPAPLPADLVTEHSPPESPSSLTAVATEDRASPPPSRPQAPPPPPARHHSRTGLYAGAVMTLGVFVAAFSMLGMRGAKSPPPSAATSVNASSTTKAAPPVLGAPSSKPNATTTASANTPPKASVSAAPSAAASVVMPTPSPAPAAKPSEPVWAAADAAAAAATGTLILPKWASQRRVYVDGKLLGNGLEQMELPCGAREVRIGSSGTPKSIAVPCGGSVDW